MTLTRQPRIALILFGLLFLGLACRFFALPAPLPTATPTIRVDELVFSEAQPGLPDNRKRIE
jgi:hypothetical protein